MSAKLDLLKRKLSKILSRAEPADFFGMIWTMRAIQSGETAASRFFENFPPEALDQRVDNTFAIHPWELETLTNLYLHSKPNLDRAGKYKIVNCRNFETIRRLINIIRDIENEQYSTRNNEEQIFFEMTRIGYRQFAWQRNYANTFQFYRNLFIYNNTEIQKIFYETYGLELKYLFLLGFYLYSLFRSSLYVTKSFYFQSKGISEESKHKTFKIIAADLSNSKLDARKSAARSTQALGHDYIAYKESTLRRHPVLQLDHSQNQLLCPIPDFLVLRITEGIYYDLVSLDKHRSKVSNIIGAQFEQYSKTIFEKWSVDCTTHRNNDISINDRSYAGVDLICKTEKFIYLIECKAAKLTIKQQYSSFFDERSTQFDELAKGVLQLWRQVSFYSKNDNMYPVLLTYDRWLFLNDSDRSHLYQRAKELAGDSLKYLSYQGNVVLCTIESLEICLSVCDSDQLSQLFTLALEDEYNGYIISVLLNRVIPEYSESERKLSLSLSDFGPEWDFTKRS